MKTKTVNGWRKYLGEEVYDAREGRHAPAIRVFATT